MFMVMIKLKSGISVYPIISEIIRFVNENHSSRNFEKRRSDFISRKISEIKKQEDTDETILHLKGFSFYSPSVYDESESTSNDLFKYMLILSNIKGELLEGLTQESVEVSYTHFGKLERQVLPPMEAYKYSGNNKTDIKHGNKSYGLLFE